MKSGLIQLRFSVFALLGYVIFNGRVSYFKYSMKFDIRPNILILASLYSFSSDVMSLFSFIL